MQTSVAPNAKHATLYVLVNGGLFGSYVALYDAYAKNPAPIGKIIDGLMNPCAIWVDAKGNVYVANDVLPSSVFEYAPGTTKPSRIYRDDIDIPFGGMVGSNGTMYVADGSHFSIANGGIAVFPHGELKPSEFLTDNMTTPHGIAQDPSGNLFVVNMLPNDWFQVVEFPSGSTNSKVLPLKHLDSTRALEDLKLDSHNDVVVADAWSNLVRFYPPPYKKQSKTLTAGLSFPTALAYGPDGSLFVGNEYINQHNGNVVIFPPGSTKPARTIVNGITAGVLGVAVSPHL